MYAAFRWIEARGGTRIVAIGRAEIRRLHLRVGMKPTGQNVQRPAECHLRLVARHPGGFSCSLSQPPLHSQAYEGGNLVANRGWTLCKRRQPVTTGAIFLPPPTRNSPSSNSSTPSSVRMCWTPGFPPSPKVVAALTEHLPLLPALASAPTGSRKAIAARHCPCPWRVTGKPPAGCWIIRVDFSRVAALVDAHVARAGFWTPLTASTPMCWSGSSGVR